MTLSVIGAGFGRTGTLSLKGALETLGFGPCYHMLEVIQNEGAPEQWYRLACGETVDWDLVFKGYNATVDWPACNFYTELMAKYPAARVILSLRDPEKWYTSCINTIFQSIDRDVPEGVPENIRAQNRMVKKLIRDNTFGGDLFDKDHAIRIFNAHNDAVRRTVPADNLLVYEPGDGWEPLCRFLDVPVPDTAYPRTNTTEEFQQRVAERERETR